MSAPTDLASLAACKAWLGLTSTGDDAVIAGLVTATSRAIYADLGRPLLPASFTEVIESGVSVPLRQWPVLSIIGCSIDGVPLPLLPTNYLLEGADAAPPGAAQRLTIRGGHRGRLAVTYRAGYEIGGEPASVPAAAPFTVQAAAPFGPWASDSGVGGLPPDAGGYSAAAGTYTFTPAAAGAAVTLGYGYVPADLAQACIEWVADRYAARGRIGQSSKTLGGQETTGFIVKAMPDVVDRLLQPYRRVAA